MASSFFSECRVESLHLQVEMLRCTYVHCSFYIMLMIMLIVTPDGRRSPARSGHHPPCYHHDYHDQRHPWFWHAYRRSLLHGRPGRRPRKSHRIPLHADILPSHELSTRHPDHDIHHADHRSLRHHRHAGRHVPAILVLCTRPRDSRMATLEQGTPSLSL